MAYEGFITSKVDHWGRGMDNVRMTKDESKQRNATIRAVRKHLTRIHHDINNPLSIVSGNVQLLQELAKALKVSDDFDSSLKDIVTAVEQLNGRAEELLVLRNLLAELEEEESE